MAFSDLTVMVSVKWLMSVRIELYHSSYRSIFMSSNFFTNYTDLKFIDKLKKNIDTCKALYFSVSFIKRPGLRLIAPNIEAALSRGARGYLITSTYQNFTDIDSLTWFYDLQTRYSRFKAMTQRHSRAFDQTGRNMGGQYSSHPLDTSKFKWE